ncbi:protein-tyrosine phosphatase [Ruminococcaceae bacterium FB2012]|nr:protein-tyrosine phosphatase [Ruminococcaceae bacterium FB2012]
MRRIMFICHGNICRSPMAEFIMKELVRREGREEEFVISSCAVSTEELGNGIYPPARAELERRGIPCGRHRAVQLSRKDYGSYDMFIVMDKSNLRRARDILGGDPEGKLSMLMTHAGISRDVSDPWYSRRFDVAFEDILQGCEGLLRETEG